MVKLRFAIKYILFFFVHVVAFSFLFADYYSANAVLTETSYSLPNNDKMKFFAENDYIHNDDIYLIPGGSFPFSGRFYQLIISTNKATGSPGGHLTFKQASEYCDNISDPNRVPPDEKRKMKANFSGIFTFNMNVVIARAMREFKLSGVWVNSECLPVGNTYNCKWNLDGRFFYTANNSTNDIYNNFTLSPEKTGYFKKRVFIRSDGGWDSTDDEDTRFASLCLYYYCINCEKQGKIPMPFFSQPNCDVPGGCLFPNETTTSLTTTSNTASSTTTATATTTITGITHTSSTTVINERTSGGLFSSADGSFYQTVLPLIAIVAVLAFLITPLWPVSLMSLQILAILTLMPCNNIWSFTTLTPSFPNNNNNNNNNNIEYKGGVGVTSSFAVTKYLNSPTLSLNYSSSTVLKASEADNYMLPFLSPIQVYSQSSENKDKRLSFLAGTIITELIILFIYACLFGLLSSVMYSGSYSRTSYALKHPRFVLIIHLLALPGLVFFSSLLSYGNVPPITATERGVGVLFLIISILSVIPLYCFILWYWHSVKKYPLRELLYGVVAENVRYYYTDSKGAIKGSSRENAKEFIVDQNVDENKEINISFIKSSVPAIFRYLLLVPKSYWPLGIQLSSRCFCLRFTQQLRFSSPYLFYFTLLHEYCLIILISVIAAVTRTFYGQCTVVYGIIAALMFIHCLFVLIVWCYRVPVLNVLQAIQSFLLGLIASFCAANSHENDTTFDNVNSKGSFNFIESIYETVISLKDAPNTLALILFIVVFITIIVVIICAIIESCYLFEKEMVKMAKHIKKEKMKDSREMGKIIDESHFRNVNYEPEDVYDYYYNSNIINDYTYSPVEADGFDNNNNFNYYNNNVAVDEDKHSSSQYNNETSVVATKDANLNNANTINRKSASFSFKDSTGDKTDNNTFKNKNERENAQNPLSGDSNPS